MTARINRPPVLTGGCQCGAIRYALYAAPTGTTACHCRMCQKAVGGPFAVYAGVDGADFAWTRGTPATFRSSSLAERDFCGNCGTPLTYRFLDSTRITISQGSLDQPEQVVPLKNIGTESRHAWLDKLNDLEGLSTEADSGADFVEKCVNYQHPDHDTGEDWTPPVK